MNFEYMGLAEGVTKIDILEWWVKNEEKLYYTKLGRNIQENCVVPAILCCNRENFQYSEKFI